VERIETETQFSGTEVHPIARYFIYWQFLHLMADILIYWQFYHLLADILIHWSV